MSRKHQLNVAMKLHRDFEEEWAKDNRGRTLPFPLVDGDFQSSYFFSLIEEFGQMLKARAPLTLSIGLLCAIEQGERFLDIGIQIATVLRIANALMNFFKTIWATEKSSRTDTTFSEMASYTAVCRN